MNIVCLDMEGVLVPEIWIAFAEESGIPELRRTTRDEPDYDKLMRWRIDLLRQRGLKLSAIQETISRIDPLPGAKDFLDALRKDTQVVILSDTFDQFAMPLMAKLGYPTLLCNTLEVDGEGYITRHLMRCEHSKLTTVKALQSIGYDTIASGDSKLSKDKCCAYLTKVGLCANDYLDREVDVSLSGGEVKRIEIATILARRGQLMIFDEPEAGIDLWSFARLTETFEQIHREGAATMVIISHQERIIKLADEIVVIAGGQIAHRGTTEEIFPLILADTLGSCPVLERKEGAQ